MKDKIKKILNGVVATIGEKLAVKLIAQYLTKENIESAIDAGLDMLEELSLKTESKIDDNILKKIREGLNIPDNDNDKKEETEIVN